MTGRGLRQATRSAPSTQEKQERFSWITSLSCRDWHPRDVPNRSPVDRHGRQRATSLISRGVLQRGGPRRCGVWTLFVSALCHVAASPRRFDTRVSRMLCPPLAASHGPDDQQRLGARRDRVGERGIRRLVGQIRLAGEQPHERPALLRDVVADRPAQHRVAGLERVEDRALRGHTLDVELHLAVDVLERPQMRREHDPDHGSVWASTDTTDGRSRTMGAQRSPALAEAYTWPPVVPKYTPHGSSESTAIASRSTLT